MTDINPQYEQSLSVWRAQKDQSLRAEQGWLALEGLYWLENGTNPFGASTKNVVVLPVGEEQSGSLIVDGKKVFLQPAPDTKLRVDGKPAGEMELKPDRSGEASELSLGSLEMIIIQRREKFGLRVWNKDRPQRLSFPGRRWFPADPGYICSARLFPLPELPTITIPDAIGMEQLMEVAGRLEFTLQGKDLLLLAIQEDESLFIIFRDETSGIETYPAGRYMYTVPDASGYLELDFNKAYNPPCAFTAFATCPLPPPQNRLTLRIEAGELAPVQAK